MDEHRQRDSLSFEKVSTKKAKSKYLTWKLTNPLLVCGAVLLCIACTVLVLGMNVGSDTNRIERDDIGTIAKRDYKAPRDFTFDQVDREATDRIREQRIAEVLPIFKWDTKYHDNVLMKVNQAFEKMQFGIEKERNRLENLRISRETPSALAQPQDDRQKWADALLFAYKNEAVFDDFLSTREISADEIDAELVKWMHGHRDEFIQNIGYDIDDDTFAWFVSLKFNDILEEGMMQVLDVVLGRMIVPTRQEIDDIGNLTIQWQENGDKRSRVVDKSEKTTIASVSSSESLVSTLLKERFSQAPKSFYAFCGQFIRPTLEFDETATQHEKQNVSDKTAELRVLEEFKKGQTIVSRGNPIKPVHYEIYEKLAQGQNDFENRNAHWIALSLIALCVSFICWRSILATTAKRQKNRDLIFMAVNILVIAIFLKITNMLCDALDSVYHWPFSLMVLFPFAAGPMLLHIVVDRYYAYLIALCSIIMASLVADDGGIVISYAIANAMAGCLLMKKPKRSNMLIKRGILIGCISGIVALALYLLRGSEMTAADYIAVTVLGMIGGLISTGIVMIGLPLSESVFGYVTSNKLLELSNLEHPALKTLFLEAPGTYQHSIMVGSLNEAAAEAIGANAILARVGGYYHDIGKVKNAQYFAENQRGDNPHNRLKPNMSALILKAHEKDGLDIARKYHLPQDIMDFIASHHGTSRIEFFYQKAKEQQDRVSEEDYRYPGPKPQTRETGICMVSDMVEAAVRSLPDKSPDKILVLVRKLINHKFTDGQFDECDLTLRDLNDIANALLGILNAFYHHRPEYPDQKREREKIENKQEADKKQLSADSSDKLEKTDISDKSDKSDKDKSDKSDKDKSDKTDKDKSDKTDKDKSDKTDKDKTDKSDKDKTDKTDKDKSDKTDKDKTDKSDKDKTDKSDKDKTDKTDKDKTDKSDKDKSGKSNKDKTDKSVELDKSDKDKMDKSDKDKSGKSNKDKTDKSVELDKTDKDKSGKSNKDKADKSEKLDKNDKSDNDITEKSNKDKSDKSENSDDENANSEKSALNRRETEEADELLKESEEERSEENEQPELIQEEITVRDTYELTFSSQVDVFKKS